jgi:hypothetical protein
MRTRSFPYQLKPLRGSRGSDTIDCAMAAPRCVDAIVDHHGFVEKVRIIASRKGRSVHGDGGGITIHRQC